MEFVKSVNYKTRNCPKCGVEVELNISFIMKNYKGHRSLDHGCGKEFIQYSLIGSNEETRKLWREFREALT